MSRRGSGFFIGCVEFSGFGGYPEKFVDSLLKQGIKLRKIKYDNGKVSGAVAPTDYWETASTARKYGVRIRAGQRSGLYFTAMRYSRRIGLYFGLLGFVMLITLNESKILDIELVSSGEITASQRSQIVSILEECGISEGKSIRSIDTDQAERRIMLELPETAWVGISAEGFRIRAAFEAVTPPPEMLNSDIPCNLVASRDAVIIDHRVRAGTLAAETGSGVQKGGLLVSGIVSDGGENILYKHASADIIGEFTQKTEFFVPYAETVSLPAGEQTEYKWLVFGEDAYPLFFGKAEQENSVYTEQNELLYLFGQELPFKLRRGVFTQLCEQEITRSAAEASELLDKRKSDYEQNFLNEFEIVDCDKSLIPQPDGIRMILVYTLRGNIAEEREIVIGQSP